MLCGRGYTEIHRDRFSRQLPLAERQTIPDRSLCRPLKSGLLNFRAWAKLCRPLRGLVEPRLFGCGAPRCVSAWTLYFLLACQAARTSTSRSGLIPARNFACLSAGCFLNQSRVACVVSGTDRKVSPLSSALLMLILEKPASSPRGGTQTGMSDHAETFCAARKSASTQVNWALVFVTFLMPSSLCAIVSVDFGPVALKGPVVPCSAMRIVHSARSRASMN